MTAKQVIVADGTVGGICLKVEDNKVCPLLVEQLSGRTCAIALLLNSLINWFRNKPN